METLGLPADKPTLFGNARNMYIYQEYNTTSKTIEAQIASTRLGLVTENMGAGAKKEEEVPAIFEFKLPYHNENGIYTHLYVDAMAPMEPDAYVAFEFAKAKRVEDNFVEAQEALQKEIDNAKKIVQGEAGDKDFAELKNAIKAAEKECGNTRTTVELLNTAKETLLAAVNKFNDKVIAKEVTDKIAAIGKVTLDSEKAIKNARKAYDALTEEQKDLAKNLDVLEAAEAELDKLLNPVVTGWTQDGNIWGYVKEDGTAAQNELLKIGANTFYFDNNGAMATGWQKIGNNWFYFYSSGRMVTGTQVIGGKTYHFANSGALL